MASDRRAWVRSDEERREREGDLASLEGDHVTRVRYFELQYEGVSGPMWSGGDFDSLDYGLELDFASGVTWSFIWKHRGPNEGLLAFEGTLVPGELRDDAAAIWDVTDHWREHGPSTILHAGAVWDWGEPRDGQAPVGSWTSDLCLVAVVLASNDRAAVITLGERGPNGDCCASADNLVVFFSLADARAAGLPTTRGL